MPGFELVRRDRNINGQNGGGDCIYIRSNLNFQMRDDLNSKILENLTVEIKKPRSKSILVSTWCRPPDSPVSHFSEIEQVIGSMDAENLDYYLLGDLNIDFCRQLHQQIELNFNSENFLRDLEQRQWDNVYCPDDPNEMWVIWKSMVMETVDKYAPLKSRRSSNRKSLWVTNELRRQIFNRDYLKKKAISTNDPEAWCHNRKARNQTNNAIKKKFSEIS